MWVQIAMAAIAAIKGMNQGIAAEEQAYKQAALDEFEARTVEEESEAKANVIYSRSVAVKGQQVAQLAASGVVVGDGSAEAIVQETDKLARRDAMAELYSGARQAASMRAGGSARKAAGNDAMLTGSINGASNAIAAWNAYSSSDSGSSDSSSGSGEG